MSRAIHAHEVLGRARRWLAEGRRVVLATVVETWGSSPRGVGAHLVIDESGAFEGSVSGGCIEGGVIAEAERVLRENKGRLLEFGVSQEKAWEVGLSCGGKITVDVRPLDDNEVWHGLCRAMDKRVGVALVTCLKDGRQALVDGDGQVSGSLPLDQSALVGDLLRGDRGRFLDEEKTMFVRPYHPPARLIVVGGVHIAQSLLPMAEMAGYATALIDPRTAFANENRFPGTRLLNSWPEQAMKELMPDEATAVVTLTHDPKIDDPALAAALDSPACYIGALGSRRTQEKRLARLAACYEPKTLARIHGPVGLNLGGRAPEQIAVAILAEMIQTRYRD